MPSNAEAKRKGESKGRQVGEEEVSALERLSPPLEGGKLYTLKAQGVMAHYFCVGFIYNSH